MLPDLSALTLHETHSTASTASTALALTVHETASTEAPPHEMCDSLEQCRRLLASKQAKLQKMDDEIKKMNADSEMNMRGNQESRLRAALWDLKEKRKLLLPIVWKLEKFVRQVGRAEHDNIPDYIERLRLDDKIYYAETAVPALPVYLQWINWPLAFDNVEKSPHPTAEMTVHCPTEGVTLDFVIEYDDHTYHTVLMKMPLGGTDSECVVFKNVNYTLRGQGNCFYLDSLFYQVSEDFKPDCLMSPAFLKKMTSQQKRGYTSSILKVFDVIASTSRKDGALEDASTFGPTRPPYQVFERITRRYYDEGAPLTRSLAAFRGWGSYEGRGWFPSVMVSVVRKEVENVLKGHGLRPMAIARRMPGELFTPIGQAALVDLEWTHMIYTTPLNTLSSAITQFYESVRVHHASAPEFTKRLYSQEYCKVHTKHAVAEALDPINDMFHRLAEVDDPDLENPYDNSRNMRQLLKDDDALTGYGKNPVNQSQFMQNVAASGIDVYFFSTLLDLFVINVWQRHLMMADQGFLDMIADHTQPYSEATSPGGQSRSTLSYPGAFLRKPYVSPPVRPPGELLSAFRVEPMTPTPDDPLPFRLRTFPVADDITVQYEEVPVPAPAPAQQQAARPDTPRPDEEEMDIDIMMLNMGRKPTKAFLG